MVYFNHRFWEFSQYCGRKINRIIPYLSSNLNNDEDMFYKKKIPYLSSNLNNDEDVFYKKKIPYLSSNLNNDEDVFYNKKIQWDLSKPNPFGTEEFVQFRQVFGLHRFKLHRHWVDGTVMSVWFRQVFGLLMVRFRHVSLYWKSYIIKLLRWSLFYIYIVQKFEE